MAGALAIGILSLKCEIGVEHIEIMPTVGHPVVYGDWLHAGADKPTVLVYGHYDVVLATLDDGWGTEPFEPMLKDGRIYARGATDDKGQLFIHVKALESYLKTDGSAPVNVKFLIEGEEEISSPNLAPSWPNWPKVGCVPRCQNSHRRSTAMCATITASC